MPADLTIHRRLTIPGRELRESVSRSGGPGGQHVNKTSTRVTLRWSVAESRTLSEGQRERLLAGLRTRLTGAGELVVHAGRSRSQARNRELARARLRELVRAGLARPRSRVASRPSRASQERRVESKHKRAATKRLRGRVRPDAE